jgi:NAD(P)-dependent dehydrogenase (short-subunit alcohol dehydrogenase family)
MDNTSKDILVTGAYGGMGSAAVRALTKKGYRVFALDLNAGEPRPQVIPVKADITDPESVNQALTAVSGHTKELYAIIHFAGIYMLDSLVELEFEALQRIFGVNTLGACYINKAFMPLLKKGSRVIITTSELAPLDPLPFTGIYAVTKAALDKYAYSLRMELQLLGISVSVLRAGAVKTRMLNVSTDALDRFCENTTLYSCNAKRFKRIVDRVEAKCIPPEKIAAKALKILGKRSPKFAYAINRNPLLCLLNILPKRLQLWAIRKVLK